MNLVLHNLVERFPMQMIPMMITKEYWANILMMLCLDFAGFPTIGSSSEENQNLQMFHLSSCS